MVPDRQMQGQETKMSMPRASALRLAAISCAAALLGLLAILFLSLSGCRKSATSSIRGRIDTAPWLSQSCIGPYISSIKDGETPVQGAKIWLAFDQEGKCPIEGFETRSDEKGYYEIITTDLPAPRERYGDYYLFVEKPGYERYVHNVTVGPYSMFKENTISLKRLTAEEGSRH